MSQPTIPDINPDITITRDQSINLLLSSIAMEELGLAHIINAEGEKIQAAIGTLKDDLCNPIPALACNINDLKNISKSVNKTLQTIIKKEMLLQFKLENVLELVTNKCSCDNDECEDDISDCSDNNNECSNDSNKLRSRIILKKTTDEVAVETLNSDIDCEEDS